MPFEIVSQTDYLLVKMSGECNGDEPVKLPDAFAKIHAETGLKYLIFQCSECNSVSSGFIRQMSQVYREIKAKNGGLRLVAANEKILELIKSQGVDKIFVNKLSFRGALVDFGLATAKEIDTNFINPFLAATQKVFKIQCFLEAKPQKPFVKKPTDPMLLGDVSGIIAITSESFKGTLAISLSEKIFCKIASNMLGEETPGISESNVDLLAELANMILGQAKTELNALGFGIQMAIPSCVWGKDHKIKHFGAGVCLVLPFETSEGTFYSEVMTHRIGAGGKAEGNAT